MNGMEMMLAQMLKSAGIDFNQMVAQFNAMGQLIAEFKAQSDRIEANQKRILELLEGQLAPASITRALELDAPAHSTEDKPNA